MTINPYQEALRNLDNYKWILKDNVRVKPSDKVEPESPRIQRDQEPTYTSVGKLAFDIRKAAMAVFQLRKGLPWDATSTYEAETLALFPQYIEKLCSWDPRQQHLFREWTTTPLNPQQVEAALEGAFPPPLRRSSPVEGNPQ